MNPEQQRLRAESRRESDWKKWGPYLSERQWGTVREDYSEDGDSWAYFSHEQARSRAYRWGEDGLAGISDDGQMLCFAVALWNGNDPILKERLFGLTNSEGNHGEDVKEYYFYLDNTPTHSYMKYLYKYPHAAFPYSDLVKTNATRSAMEPEYELLDTGVFEDDRYFDVFVEYAKEGPDDILIRISAHNRGPETADLHLLPTLWFRNTWAWNEESSKPSLRRLDGAGQTYTAILADHGLLGEYILYLEGDATLLFTENESNAERLFGTPNSSVYVKDGINDHVVAGHEGAVNPAQTGTKVAAQFTTTIAAGESEVVRLRLTRTAPDGLAKAYAEGDPFADHFDALFHMRTREADTFYAELTPPKLSSDAKSIMRQALAGMLWTKQYYEYDVTQWLQEHGYEDRPSLRHANIRNKAWFHMANADIISMPDKWEYPWYAAWDLAFHTVALAIVDLGFAKEQLELMLDERYLHPNGQIPAYEWNFGDVNPPVHAWALMRIYSIEKELQGEGDLDFLKDAFYKLTVNFTWWVNRKDPEGNDLFGGGFLGLDNIGVFDRSSKLPTGGYLEQSDGTAWMAFYALSMLQIALELALHDSAYQSMANKYLEHFLWIFNAVDPPGPRADELWDEEDGFFYDVLHLPDGRATRLKVRSLVGLLPLAVSAVLNPEEVERLPEFMNRVRWIREHRPHLFSGIPSLSEPGLGDRRLLSMLDEAKLRRVLERMLDEDEFLSAYGIRSISRVHREQPYVVHVAGAEYRVDYLPAESNSGMFGGNSNWRGPVWFPMNFLLIRGLLLLYGYYGDEFTVECPTGSGRQMTLWQVSQEIGVRLARIFLRNEKGRRPVFGGTEIFQSDPHWSDCLLFYEYFHGDNGAGLGASHQTGWTGLVASIFGFFGSITSIDDIADSFDARRRTSRTGQQSAT